MPIIKQTTLYEFKELDDKAKKKAIEWYRDIVNSHGLSDEIDEAMKERAEWAGIPDAKFYYSLSNCQGDGACFEVGIDIPDFIVWQKALKLAIDLKLWTSVVRVRPARGDVLPADLKVGDMVSTDYTYKDRDEQGRAVKNSKGGYTHIKTVSRVEKGSTILAIETNDGTTFITTNCGTANDKILDEWKSLLFPISVLETVLANDVEVRVTISHSRRSNYYHWNTMVVDVEHWEGKDTTIEEASVNSMVNDVEEAFKSWSRDVARLLEEVGYNVITDMTSDETISEQLEESDHLFKVNGKHCDCL